MTAYDLRAHGAGRLGDALRLIAPVRGWTVDGFDAEPRDARGALTLVLDGVPWQGTSTVEPGMLDALPVAVSEIDRIVYCPGTSFVAGRLVGPTLRVRTRPPERAAVLADYGNETGDPGPARYRDPELPNVDHWGPDGELVARSGHVWATLRARSFLPTDTAIVARTSAASGRFPEHQTLLGAVSARSPSGAAQGRVAAFSSGELPFLPRAGREVAVGRRWAQAGVRRAGRTDVPPAHIQGGVRTLGAPVWAAPDSVVARASDWREVFVRSSGGVAPVAGLHVGARAELLQARGDERLPDFDAPVRQESATAATAGLWAQVLPTGEESPSRYLPTWARHLTVETTLATRADGGSRVGGGVLSGGEVRPEAWRGWGVGWSATARRTPAAASPTAGYWRAAGLAPLVRDGGTGADVPTDDVSARAELTPSDWTWRDGGGPFPPLGVALAGGWTRSPELVVSRGSDAAVSAQTEAWSRRWAEASAWTRLGLGAAWRLTADGALTWTASDGDAVWPEAPAAQASVGATFRPDRTLALSARAEASTASNSRAARSDVPARVPGGVVVDVSARRSVWGDRLALALVGHNVLGAPEQPSAVGARLGPRLHARLSARF